MVAPKLRFREFDGDWKQEALKNFATFSKGKGISKSDISEDGINLCIRYGELYTTYGQVINFIQSKTNVSKDECVLSKSGDVIIPASGETQIDIATASCVLHDDIILGGDLNILSHQENGSWLAYYLSSAKKLDIAQLAQGNSVVHLYSSQLKDLKINKPSKEEQTKIASFLSAVDEKISQLTQKHQLLSQYKQGMMQKLFSQQIRFKADDGSEFGEWVQGTLGEVTALVARRNKNDIDAEIYSVTNSHGFVKQNEYFEDRRIAGEDTSSYKIIKRNEFAYNPARINVGSIALFNLADFGIISSLYVCFEVKENISIDFLAYFLKLESTIKNYALYGEGGVRIYLWYPLFSKVPFSYPCLEEQAKIANFLFAIDQKIEVVAQQIEQAKQWKKGLLQQMFV